MKLALDLDDVLRDSLTPMINKFKAEYPELADQVKPITAWDLHQFFPIGKEIYRLWFGPWCQDCFEFGDIYDGVHEFIKALKNQGHMVYLLTSQPRGAEHYTLAWVDRHAIQHDGILFCHDKGVTRFDVLLDDGQHNLEAVAKNGTVPIAFDRPWNQEWGGLRVLGATEKDKYNEFLAMTKNYLGHRNGIAQ